MRDEGKMRSILLFIKDNPGCFCSDVLIGTEVSKSSVTSIISRLHRDGLIKRTGQKRRYRYFVTGKAIQRERKAPYSRMTVGDVDKVNPLSSFIDKALREVRSQ